MFGELDVVGLSIFHVFLRVLDCFWKRVVLFKSVWRLSLLSFWTCWLRLFLRYVVGSPGILWRSVTLNFHDLFFLGLLWNTIVPAICSHRITNSSNPLGRASLGGYPDGNEKSPMRSLETNKDLGEQVERKI